MTGGDDGGVAENSLADDDADIDADLADAAVGNAELLDEALVLVHQQHPELLGIHILHHGMHVVVDPGGGAEAGTLLGLCLLATLAQLTGRHDGDGLGGSHAVILAQVVDAHLSQRVQVVVAAFEDAFHQRYGIFLGRAGTNEDGQQLSITQRLRPQSFHLFTRTVFRCPLVNF